MIAFQKHETFVLRHISILLQQRYYVPWISHVHAITPQWNKQEGIRVVFKTPFLSINTRTLYTLVTTVFVTETRGKRDYERYGLSYALVPCIDEYCKQKRGKKNYHPNL